MKTQLRTLGRVWPSGRGEVASFRISLAMISVTNHPNSWKKLPPCWGTPQDLQESSRNGTESSALTICWGDRSHSVISQWIHYPSIPPVLPQVDSTGWLFPLKEEIFPSDFVSGPPKSPLSQQPVFDFLFWRLFSAFAMTWQHNWVPETYWDHPLQTFLYINTVVWGLTCRIPPSLTTAFLKYGLYSSLEMGQ